MPDIATIEIPRITDERPERYAARSAYITMGANRSLERVRQITGKKPASLRNLERWSVADGWVRQAADYDRLVADLAAQRAAAQYLADLDEHRERYGKSGKVLHGVALKLLTRLSADSAATESLATIARALTVAADLEAHALRLGDLIPRLTADGGGDV